MGARVGWPGPVVGATRISGLGSGLCSLATPTAEVDMGTDVFLSVGRTYTEAQERFVTAVEVQLRAVGLTPRTVGRNDFSSNAPLKRIGEALEECQGTVILAFERTRAEMVTDRPGSAEESTSKVVRLPTVWNQIEATMSYARHLPLLVIVEHGLKDEGLLESRYDWYVQWVDLTEDALRTFEFQGVLDDWRKRMAKHEELATAQSPASRPGDLTLQQILGALTVKQAWASGGAVFSALAAVAVIAYRLGSGS